MFKTVEPQMKEAWLPEALLRREPPITSTYAGLLDSQEKKKKTEKIKPTNIYSVKY